MTSSTATDRLKKKIKGGGGLEKFEIATESMSTDKKLEFLKEIKRQDLVEVFKDYKPRVSKARKRGAPLDQRISITVTKEEREKLDSEVAALKKAKQKVSMSELIRNRAMGSVDLESWKQIAEKALVEIEDISDREKDLRKERSQHIANIDDLDFDEDDEEYALEQIKLMDVEKQLRKIVAQNKRRSFRITGRMSMHEAETVKWRSQRLSITASDYLRMMIFGLEPDSSGDDHMSYDAKRRFYVSILEVSQNGWGSPPEIVNCKQCENYIDQIRALRETVKQLETFSDI